MRLLIFTLLTIAVFFTTGIVAPSAQALYNDNSCAEPLAGKPCADDKYVCKKVVDSASPIYECVCRWGEFEVIKTYLFGTDASDICEFLNLFPNDLGEAVLLILNYAIAALTALVIIISMLSIVVAGYIYMTAGGSADRVSTAKNWIIAALLGITIALAAWTILYMINPLLVG